MKSDGDAERDGSNADGRVWGTLLPELTLHPVHESCRISLQQFKVSHAAPQPAVAEKLAVPHFSHSCSGMGTSYSEQGRAGKGEEEVVTFQRNLHKHLSQDPEQVLTNTEQLTTRGNSTWLVRNEVASAHAEKPNVFSLLHH